MQTSTGSYNITVRSMLTDDVGMIVDIHLESFQGFFLTFLGHKFLSLLYKSILSDPEGIALVAVLDEKIEGFVAGVTQQRSFYQRLIRKQKWAFAVATLPALAKRPSIVPRLLRALKRPSEAHQASDGASLMSIAVRPEAQGHGIGAELVKIFCKELGKRGVSAVSLTTDRDNNDRMIYFYQKGGFSISRTFITPEGRAMNEYVISLK